MLGPSPLSALIAMAPAPFLAALSPAQRRACGRAQRFRTWLAPRRSGKSYAACAWLLGGSYGQTSVYGARTLKSAKAIVLGNFAELSVKHGLRLDIRPATGTITEPSGHIIQLYGLHDQSDVDLMRGLSRVRRVFLDEGGAFPSRGKVRGEDESAEKELLKYAVQDVLQPMLIDVAGELCIGGTPGIRKRGYFFDLSGNPGAKPPDPGRWQTFHWTVEENPFIDSSALVAEILAANGWTRDHPSFKREYLAIWCDDLESLIYTYRTDVVPPPPAGLTVLIVDFGVVDRTAFLVGRQPHDMKPHLFLVDAYAKSHMQLGDIARKIVEMSQLHNVNAIYADEGALGKMLANTLRMQYGIAILPVPKANKRGRIDTVRGRLASGTLHVCNAARAVLDEWSALCWNDDRDDHHPEHSDDVSDCCTYLCALDYFTQQTPFVAPQVTESYEDKLFREAQERSTRSRTRI
jgi:Terminase RNaseH-like domain